MMEVLTKTMVVISLPYKNVSNQHTVHLHLQMFHVNYIKVKLGTNIGNRIQLFSSIPYSIKFLKKL